MADNGGKLRQTRFKGYELTFTCSDEEYPELIRDLTFLNALIREQYPHKYAPPRLASVRSDEEVAAAKAKKDEGKRIRYIEFRGENLDVFVTDDEYDRLCKDENALLTIWYINGMFHPDGRIKQTGE